MLNEFKYGFLYPTLASTVCTCSYQALDQYPATLILAALDQLTRNPEFHDTQPLLWKTRYGTSDVVQRLLEPVADLRLGCTVESVQGQEHTVLVEYRNAEDQRLQEGFDHLILATQANTSRRLLLNPSESEETMLSCFQYETIEVTIHTDSTFMPAERDQWSTFNQVTRARQTAMCTVWLNQFHEDWPPLAPKFQTIGPWRPAAQEHLLKQLQLQRPIVTAKSYRGWNLREQLHRETHRRIWFCGSYATRGIPLLETAYCSVRDLPLLTDSRFSDKQDAVGIQ